MSQDSVTSSQISVQRVGVIGGGQLAWMMAEAAEKLGIELWVQTPSHTDPAVAITAQTILAPVDDAIATAQLAVHCDVITFENEFVNLPALAHLAQQGTCFRPSLDALRPLLDKYDQRTLMESLGLPTPSFTLKELAPHAESFPVVLKTRRHGYDGQGTFIVHTPAELEATLADLASVPVLLEKFVAFEQELAVMAARSQAGEIVIYPIVETQQENQVCRRVIAPARVNQSTTTLIEKIVRTLLTHLQVVGIFGIEFFLTKDGTVLINEIAPRTHNSGHYTLDACETSQFEQQLRAICGLPLGSTAMTSAGAVMVNLLGYEQSESDYATKRQALAAFPHAHVHWYGKTESRLGRKLGHVTVLLNEADAMQDQAIAIAHQIESLWYSS
ncbi:5-(carboxyamino)imidazole ribonucleotide synthase [Leptolyngbya sp. Cla-17]|uniref:5-(carboxyamino)imidazole ribonucleotide synthase n=1 Tax=Leptolyngbya sp. Cla-17 TaxID=2803751 RepID=UPI0014928707|nr:5-(carboxyamino)imidazole ribonucleotide synthase [Leptolyngbya sp. Cla-17]